MAYRALLHFNGTNGSTVFTDTVGTLSWSRAGVTAALDTSSPKFGSAELTLTTGQVGSTTFTIPSTWTVDQWFNAAINSTLGVIALVGPGSGNTTSATFNGTGSGITYRVSLTGASADFTTTGSKTAFSTGTDYHLEMNYDAVAQKFYFYIDGVKDAEIASATPMSGSGWSIAIGNNGLGNSFNGSIDEFRFTDATEHSAGTTFTPPTVEYALPAVITPTQGAVALTGVAPAIFTGTQIVPGAGALVLTGVVPSVVNTGQRNIAPNTAVLALTGQTAKVRDRIYPDAVSLTLTGAAPTATIVVNQTASPGTGSLSLTAGAPNVLQGMTADIVRRAYSATAQITASNAMFGEVTLRKRSAAGYMAFAGAAEREPYSATGQMSSSMIGAVTRRAYQALTRSAVLTRRKYTATGQMSAVVGETYRTHAFNTTINAVTEFNGFRFNSYALIGGVYYGAGPDGLVRLDGEDDAGTNINWQVRTGQTDDKQTGLKRLPEVVLGLRASGPVRVRVYPDDNQYFDYMLPNVKTDTIRQHRVKPGKGMESRYFAVELQGVSNSAIEIDSLQMNLTPTTRRLG